MELFLEIAEFLDVTILLFGNLTEEISVWNNIYLSEDKDNIGCLVNIVGITTMSRMEN